MPEDLQWDEPGLRQRCADLRDTLAEAGLASANELTDYWPGGKENAEPGIGAWIYCYASYVRMAGQPEAADVRERRVSAEAEVLAALRGAGVAVELVTLDTDGAPLARTVYPKSFDTLCHVQARDRELLALAMGMHALRDLGGEAIATWGRALYEEIAYQHRVLVWIVTTEGPGLPFPAEEPRPEPPGWTLLLDPWDITSILKAHQTVNGRRIAVIGDLMAAPSKGGRKGKTAGWATLGAMAASELGVSSQSLLRDWSLAGWLAQLLLTAEVKRDAAESVAGGRRG